MKKIIYIVSLIACCSSLFAQEAKKDSSVAGAQQNQKVEADTTIFRDVDVVREYTPVIREAGKINTMPEIKPINTKKITPSYSVWTSAFTPEADVIPTLEYALAVDSEDVRVTDHFIKLGAGNYTSFLGEVYTPIYKDSKYLIDIYGKHNSSFGRVALSPEQYGNLPSELDSKASNNDNKVRASLLRSYRKAELRSFLGLGFKKFRYYGYDSFMQAWAENENDEVDGLKQSFTTIDANIQYLTKDFVGKWKYDVQTNYMLFHSKTGVNEHTIYTKANGVYRLETSSLNATAEMYNIFLSLPENDDELHYDFENEENANSHTVLKIGTNYKFENNLGEFRIGVKGVFGLGQGRSGTIIPDICGTIRLIEKKLYLNAGITGDYRVNNYRTITAINQYASPDVRVEDTYTPIDVYLALKSNVVNKLNVDLFAGYKVVNNPYFFVNKKIGKEGNYLNNFDVVYDKDAGLFNGGISAIYNWTDKLAVSAQAQYNAWALDKQDKAWQLPAFMFTLNSSYQATDYLRFKLAYNADTKIYAKVDGKAEAMDNVHDVSLGVNYSILSFANVFLDLNNIFGSRYQNWYGYSAHRFNFMLGCSLNF